MNSTAQVVLCRMYSECDTGRSVCSHEAGVKFDANWPNSLVEHTRSHLLGCTASLSSKAGALPTGTLM